MLKAILFDLDGTLLDIELGSFLDDYFSALGPVLSTLTGMDVTSALDAVMKATGAMCGDHPGISNQDVFNRTFAALTGIDLSHEAAAGPVDRFYRESFPTLRGTCAPHENAAQAVSVARELGLMTSVATNPIFPLAAVVERMRWADLSTSDFEVITSYETSEACKPAPVYFRAVSESLGVSPSECLMVGDDPSLDMAAADVGMKTFYVGARPSAGADWTGTLGDLVDLLPRLTG